MVASTMQTIFEIEAKKLPSDVISTNDTNMSRQIALRLVNDVIK